MDEIEKAYKAHASVDDSLKSSPIILRKHPTQVLHSINNEYKRGNTINPDDLNALMRARARSHKYLADKIPPPDEIELSFRTQWLRGTHHDLLMSILKSGRVPLGWGEYWIPDSPPTTLNALSLAAHLGYSVPKDFLHTKSTSYSESEAFLAAYMLVSDNFRLSIPDKFSDWSSYVCQLTGQFLVPDPVLKDKIPYILDQLWIVANTNNQVRLIGLEIDGEIHLNEEKKKQDEKRDLMLAAMGYETYHVAGWWCRIDPYRVICEFMSASGICPNADKYLNTHNLQSISDYVCDICKKPMVRWDINWITKVEDDNGNLLLAHHNCARDLVDNRMEY
jgi:hypothetical protein